MFCKNSQQASKRRLVCANTSRTSPTSPRWWRRRRGRPRTGRCRSRVSKTPACHCMRAADKSRLASWRRHFGCIDFASRCKRSAPWPHLKVGRRRLLAQILKRAARSKSLVQRSAAQRHFGLQRKRGGVWALRNPLVLTSPGASGMDSSGHTLQYLN